MMSRAERSFLANWWWTVDRWLLAALLALMVLGMVITMAASPPEAERLNLPIFYFVHRHVIWLIPSAIAMVCVSMISPRYVRRSSLILFAAAMGLVVLALMFGHEVKGSKRWIFGVQPSEFVKPAFVILAAWAFSEGGRRKDVPGTLIALLLLPATIIPLILQPDIGQTMLISMVWAALFFMAGVHWFWVGGLGGAGIGGLFLAYKFLPHVRGRILSFLEPASAGGGTNSFQVETALDSFVSGGWLGRGPGEGVIKRILPDSHTDFAFAVSGEEFGILACLFLSALFAFVVLRGLLVAYRDEDPFCRFAAAGMVILFGIQSCINIAVNLHLMPAKGMTLPFISYGGSSMLAMAIGMGFLLAVTRRRPRSEVYQQEAERAVPQGLLA